MQMRKKKIYCVCAVGRAFPGKSSHDHVDVENEEREKNEAFETLHLDNILNLDYGDSNYFPSLTTEIRKAGKSAKFFHRK